jgi:hypothetical protein
MFFSLPFAKPSCPGALAGRMCDSGNAHRLILAQQTVQDYRNHGEYVETPIFMSNIRVCSIVMAPGPLGLRLPDQVH